MARTELLATLPAEPEQVAVARQELAHYLRAHGFVEDGVAVLLVSELVTNAVRHGGGPVQLSARPDSRVLRVEVRDTDPSSAPVMLAGATTDLGGRGLHLVDVLADRWGWARSSRGKTVWFELDR